MHREDTRNALFAALYQGQDIIAKLLIKKDARALENRLSFRTWNREDFMENLDDNEKETLDA